MKTDLDMLIESLEEEKQELQTQINDLLAEKDYEYISHIGEALNRVEQKLFVFYSMKGPLKEEEHLLERMLKMRDEFIEKKLSYGHFDGRIEYQKEKIQKLRSEKIFLVDNQEIDNAIFNLHQRKWKRFTLNWGHRGYPFQLVFKMSENNMLEISANIKLIMFENDPDDLEEDQRHLFKNFGFELNEKGDRVVYFYDMRGFKDALNIKTLLSRIIYQIGYFGEERTGWIEFFN